MNINIPQSDKRNTTDAGYERIMNFIAAIPESDKHMDISPEEVKTASPFKYEQYDGKDISYKATLIQDGDKYALSKEEPKELEGKGFEQKFKELVAEYLKVIEELKELEVRVADIGEQLGKTQDEVVKIIAEEEDGYFHPATSQLVAARLQQNRSKVSNYKSELGQLRKDFEGFKNQLKKKTDMESYLHTKIYFLLGGELDRLTDEKEINQLDKLIEDMKIPNDALQDKLLHQCFIRRFDLRRESNPTPAEELEATKPEVTLESTGIPSDGEIIEDKQEMAPEVKKKPEKMTEWAKEDPEGQEQVEKKEFPEEAIKPTEPSPLAQNDRQSVPHLASDGSYKIDKIRGGINSGEAGETDPVLNKGIIENKPDKDAANIDDLTGQDLSVSWGFSEAEKPELSPADLAKEVKPEASQIEPESQHLSTTPQNQELKADKITQDSVSEPVVAQQTGATERVKPERRGEILGAFKKFLKAGRNGVTSEEAANLEKAVLADRGDKKEDE